MTHAEAIGVLARFWNERLEPTARERERDAVLKVLTVCTTEELRAVKMAFTVVTGRVNATIDKELARRGVAP